MQYKKEIIAVFMAAFVFGVFYMISRIAEEENNQAKKDRAKELSSVLQGQSNKPNAANSAADMQKEIERLKAELERTKTSSSGSDNSKATPDGFSSYSVLVRIDLSEETQVAEALKKTNKAMMLISTSPSVKSTTITGFHGIMPGSDGKEKSFELDIK